MHDQRGRIEKNIKYSNNSAMDPSPSTFFDTWQRNKEKNHKNNANFPAGFPAISVLLQYPINFDKFYWDSNQVIKVLLEHEKIP